MEAKAKENIEELRAYADKGPAVSRATCGWAAGRLEYLEEAVEDYVQLNDRMGEILTATANALKGEPEPLSRHDWSDLAGYALGLVARFEVYEREVERLQEQVRREDSYAAAAITDLTHQRERALNERDGARRRVAELEAETRWQPGKDVR